jgi:hypothetical protein
MSLRAAFFIAAFTGVVAGAAAGRLRKMMHPDDESPFPAALYGGIGAAIIFGAAVAFDRMAQFLLWEFSPISAKAMLDFTVVGTVLLAFVVALYE